MYRSCHWAVCGTALSLTVHSQREALTQRAAPSLSHNWPHKGEYEFPESTFSHSLQSLKRVFMKEFINTKLCFAMLLIQTKFLCMCDWLVRFWL